jgi:hypothetical protein
MFKSKKASPLILAVVSLIISRVIFLFVHDPEGPNLLVVIVLAALIYAVSLIIAYSLQRKQILRIVTWSTLALIVPIIGQLCVDEWNWGPGDFFFAWVFFNLLGLSYTFVTNKITNRNGKITGGIIVIAIFAFVWIRLATG